VRHSFLFAKLLFVLIAIASFPREASAQEFTRRSYILPSGSVELTGEPARPKMLGIGVSDGDGFDPFHLPLHLYFGVSEDFTLGIVHDFGLCFNCDRPYNDVGLGMLYRLTTSQNFELDLHAVAPLISNFDPFNMGGRIGVLGRVNIGSVVALVFDPSLYIGLTNRDEGNREGIGLPVWVYFQVTPSIAPFVGTGLHGPLDDFGDHYSGPLEAGSIFSVNADIDLGFVVQFWNALGRRHTLDARELGFLGRFRV
jgi:hypothetical protein